ncbi:MAG: hypothetical protein PVI59_13370 [Anaerolineae bacterium]
MPTDLELLQPTTRMPARTHCPRAVLARQPQLAWDGDRLRLHRVSLSGVGAHHGSTIGDPQVRSPGTR